MSTITKDRLYNEFKQCWRDRSTDRYSFLVHYHDGTYQYLTNIKVKGTKDNMDRIFDRFVDHLHEVHGRKLAQFKLLDIAGTFASRDAKIAIQKFNAET